MVKVIGSTQINNPPCDQRQSSSSAGGAKGTQHRGNLLGAKQPPGQPIARKPYQTFIDEENRKIQENPAKSQQHTNTHTRSKTDE